MGLFKNFKSIWQNIYQFINELLIGAFYCITLVNSLSIKGMTTDQYNKVCMNLILTSWILCFGLSIISFLIDTIEKFKKYIKKKRHLADMNNRVYPISKDLCNAKMSTD